MARVVFSGVDPRLATQLSGFLTADRHKVHREKPNASITALLDANVVFAGGAPNQYLSLVRRIRALDPVLCLVVVARCPDTSEWLEAIEAGATDYWSSPFDAKLLRSLIATAIARRSAALGNTRRSRGFTGGNPVRT